MRQFIALCLVLLLAGPAFAADKLWSYDPADAATRAFVDNGLTFHFDKGMMGFRVMEVLSTQGAATAVVEPVNERELGARLDRILPPGAFERELYAVQPQKEGPAMIRAFCPGSTKGWMVFGPLRERRGVTVHILGDNPGGSQARLCASLNFNFRAAWELPVNSAGGSMRPPLRGTY